MMSQIMCRTNWAQLTRFLLFPTIAVEENECSFRDWETLDLWIMRTFTCIQSIVLCCSISKSCLALCDPPGSSLHGIFQARVLEWVAMPSSRDLPDPGIELVSPAPAALAGGFLIIEPPRKPLIMYCRELENKTTLFIAEPWAGTHTLSFPSLLKSNWSDS